VKGPTKPFDFRQIRMNTSYCSNLWYRATVALLTLATLVGAISVERAFAAEIASLEVAREAINRLGLDLLRRSGGSDANALLSPYSIQTALAMTWAGADGETRQEMQRALHFPDDEAVLHESMEALRLALENAAERTVQLASLDSQIGGAGQPGQSVDVKGDHLSLRVANRLFGQEGYPFREPFLALTRDSYAAGMKPLNFVTAPDESRRHINEWVYEQTRERIRDLIPSGEIDERTRLVLVNAICMLAPWEIPFPASATRPAPFHLRGGGKVDAPTMQRKGQMGYAQHEGFSAITVRYIGGEVQFLILLPDPGQSLEELEARLTGSQLVRSGSAPASEVILHLPRFKLEPPLMRLKDHLQAMGMTTAFIPGTANFDRMAPRELGCWLYVKDAFHKTFLALDEAGTEAAAATAVVIQDVSGPVREPDPVEVRVDRPFLFAVQHRPSGACLFLGRLVDPQ
jgi:serpin B